MCVPSSTASSDTPAIARVTASGSAARAPLTPGQQLANPKTGHHVGGELR